MKKIFIFLILQFSLWQSFLEAATLRDAENPDGIIQHTTILPGAVARDDDVL